MSVPESNRLFFVDRGGKTGPADRYCDGCPVRSSCRNYAILYDEDGFWAGTSESERAFIQLASPGLKEAIREEQVKSGRLENRDIDSLIRLGRQREDSETIEVLYEFDLLDGLEFPEERVNGSQSVSERIDGLIGSVSNLFRELGLTIS